MEEVDIMSTLKSFQFKLLKAKMEITPSSKQLLPIKPVQLMLSSKDKAAN
jgi:hypothetical protein